MDNNGYNNLDSNQKKNNESMSNVRKKPLDWDVIATILLIIVLVPAVIIFFPASYKPGSGFLAGLYPLIYRCLAILSLALLIVSLSIIWGIKHLRKKKNPDLYIYEDCGDYTLNIIEKILYNKKTIGETIVISIILCSILGPFIIRLLFVSTSGEDAAINLWCCIVSSLLFLFLMYWFWKEHICDFISKKKSNSSSVVNDLSLNNTFQNNIEQGISNGKTKFLEKKQLSIKQKTLLNKLKIVLIVLSIVWSILYILFHFSIIEFGGDAYELFIDFEICMKEMNILVSLLIAIGIPCDIYGLVFIIMDAFWKQHIKE